MERGQKRSERHRKKKERIRKDARDRTHVEITGLLIFTMNDLYNLAVQFT